MEGQEGPAPTPCHVVADALATRLGFARVAALCGAAVMAFGVLAPELLPELRGAIEAEAMLVMVVLTAPVWLAVGALAREVGDNTLHKAAIGSFSCQLLGWALSATSPVAWFGSAVPVLVACLLFLVGLCTFLFARPFHLAPRPAVDPEAPVPRKVSPETAAALAASEGRPQVLRSDRTLSPATADALSASAGRPRRAIKVERAPHQPVVAGAGAVFVGLFFAVKLAAKAKFLAKWSLFRTFALALRSDPAALLLVVANGVLLVGTALTFAVGVRLLRSDRVGRTAARVGTLALLLGLHQLVFRVLHLGAEAGQVERILRIEHSFGAVCLGLLWWAVFRWLSELLAAHQEAQVRALTASHAPAP